MARAAPADAPPAGAPTGGWGVVPGRCGSADGSLGRVMGAAATEAGAGESDWQLLFAWRFRVISMRQAVT